MPDPASKLVTLTSSPSEFEAAAIAAALSDQGIPARVSGGTIAGFRAEVPGEAQVLVFEHDLDRARNTLRAVRADSVDIDWDDVNLGESEPATETATSPPGPVIRKLVIGLAIAMVVAAVVYEANRRYEQWLADKVFFEPG